MAVHECTVMGRAGLVLKIKAAIIFVDFMAHSGNWMQSPGADNRIVPEIKGGENMISWRRISLDKAFPSNLEPPGPGTGQYGMTQSGAWAEGRL